MAKKAGADKPIGIQLPGHELIASKAYQEAVGLSDLEYQNHKLTEIAKLLWRHSDSTQEEDNVRRHIKWDIRAV
jgi:hypothetical protein